VWSLVAGPDAPHASVLGVDVITDSQRPEYVAFYQQIGQELNELADAKKLNTPWCGPPARMSLLPGEFFLGVAEGIGG